MKNKDDNLINNFVREKVNNVQRRNIPVLTDFLDPSEAQICEDYLKRNQDKVSFSFFGGYSEAERKRLFIAPSDQEIYSEDFKIIVIQASAKKLVKEITHRDILGAVMSTGIKREKTGDIFIIPQGAVILADKGMEAYITGNFPLIKGNSFSTEVFSSEQYSFPESEFTEKVISLSSRRLDGFIARAYNLSRTDAQEFVNSGRVKVNHKENLKTDFILSEGDRVSVRGKGRFVVKEELGKSKKDNFRILINIY